CTHLVLLLPHPFPYPTLFRSRPRAAPHRHDGTAPVADRRSREPGPRGLADRGAAAASAAFDVGRRPGLPAHPGGLRAVPRGQPGVPGRARDVRRSGRGMLAAVAPVDALGVVRMSGTRAVLLAVAVRTGLDRCVSATPGEPATHRTGRHRQTLGAEEPEPPRGTRRVAARVPGRAGDPDPS